MNIGTVSTTAPRELLRVLEGGGVGKAEGMPKSPLTGGAEGAKPFSNILDSAVAEVDGKLQAAGAETTKLLTGETTNVHQAVIAMQEASVAFSLMVEVRNKLVESYQELMRMQV